MKHAKYVELFNGFMTRSICHSIITQLTRSYSFFRTQRYRSRPDCPAIGSKPAIASEEGSASVRLDVLKKHLSSRSHRDAHAWAFPDERIQALSIADSEVGKMIASPEVANRKQFVAYFRLLHKLVLLNVSLDLAFIIINFSFALFKF